MAKLQKISKGEPDYLKQQKKVVMVKTIVLITIALAVFLIGYWSTKTKANLLSVVAVLGLLPASKSMVSFIMYLRTPKYSETIVDAAKTACGEGPVLYNLYLTSYKQNFPLICIAVRGNNLMGYTEFDTCDTDACEEHLKLITSQNSFKNLNIKIFKNSELKKFEDRLVQLQKADTGKRETELLELMKDISL